MGVYDPDYLLTLNSVLMINAFVIFLEYFVVIVIQSSKSGKAGTRTREDNTKNIIPSDSDIESDIRWKKIVKNHWETIPFSFIVFFIATYVVMYNESRLGLIVVISVFVLLRILHTICYIFALQPFRSLIWLASNFCVITAGVIGVIDAFRYLKILQDAGFNNA